MTIYNNVCSFSTDSYSYIIKSQNNHLSDLVLLFRGFFYFLFYVSIVRFFLSSYFHMIILFICKINYNYIFLRLGSGVDYAVPFCVFFCIFMMLLCLAKKFESIFIYLFGNIFSFLQRKYQSIIIYMPNTICMRNSWNKTFFR